MAIWLTTDEYRKLAAVVDLMIPADETPGAAEAGTVDYIDGLLGAFEVDPPRIWAGGPFSGRTGGPAGFAEFLPLSALDELAWRTRIEGSLGIAEREFNGPVVGLHQRYREGLDSLGVDFVQSDVQEQARRLKGNEMFASLVYEHVCEGMYGPPEYGGNRNGIGWSLIGTVGDVQPRGWTDDEVSLP